MLLKLLSESIVLLLQLSVLGLCAHGDIRDQLQMVLQLVFTLCLFSSLVATFGFFLFNGFLGAAHLAFVHACKVPSLLILQLPQLLLVVVDVLVDGFVDFVDRVDVGLLSVFLNTFAYPKLSLKFIDLLSVLSLILDVSLGAARDLPFHFLVFLVHTFYPLF